ncbi:MAG: PIG-L family deacetylase [Saprospiraceae bacterium]|nr:PIG-L family deacetylase [Saprospiraceae bacterium]
MKHIFLLFITLFFLSPLSAQKPAKPSASDIHQQIKKLNVLGSVLYVAAHPDDENQRLISYCANEKLYDVTYLSLTRGDGGQNLIGPELSELLGVLRTQELLMARSVDGGKQRFSRANDFGFSKSPEETLRFWNKEAVLSDVVWTIRQTQPDVIINRFYHDEKYVTHGHHTASAMLSVEAFDLAGKADVYPEQLKYVQPWQPNRVFFNTSWWFFGSREKFEQADKTNLYPADLGVFLPMKGKSNSEVAAEARSMHRCQGFGAMSSRGESVDWFDFIKGERPPTKDPFDGLNTTWTRVPGGAPIGEMLQNIDREFRSDNPAASVPYLLKVMTAIENLPDGHWKQAKLADIKEVIRHCLGIYLEATASEPAVSPGRDMQLKLECINRSGLDVLLKSVVIAPSLWDTTANFTLANNKGFVLDKKVRVPENMPFSAPYWLQTPSSNGMYKVDEQTLRGEPETPRALRVAWTLLVQGKPLVYTTDVAYKVEEPALGEIWRPFEVLPPAFVEFTESSYIFPETERVVRVRVRAGRDSVQGLVNLRTNGKDWSSRTAAQSFVFAKKGDEKTFEFTVRAGDGTVQLEAVAEVDGKIFDRRLVEIKYDHIPQQSVLLPSAVKASRIDLKVKARNVAYFVGAGDEVPAALRQMGCTVTLLEDKDFEKGDLNRFDAIVLGIRAYNTKEKLKNVQPMLLEYVKNGGNLVVQYNTTGDLVLDQLGPFPMKLSRTRVTDETAEVRFLLPGHAALNTPNKLSNKDFEGWVQERGLYFPGEWDKAFEAPLSMNDPGEKAADGALLVAKYGKGHYVYTGVSFFRELPAGVPGAYRLLANLISIGK